MENNIKNQQPQQDSTKNYFKSIISIGIIAALLIVITIIAIPSQELSNEPAVPVASSVLSEPQIESQPEVIEESIVEEIKSESTTNISQSEVIEESIVEENKTITLSIAELYDILYEDTNVSEYLNIDIHITGYISAIGKTNFRLEDYISSSLLITATESQTAYIISSNPELYEKTITVNLTAVESGYELIAINIEGDKGEYESFTDFHPSIANIVNMSEMLDNLRNNELRATDKYLYNHIELTGTVFSIDENFLILSKGDGLDSLYKIGFTYDKNQSYYNQLLELNYGDEITIHGFVSDISDGYYTMGLNRIV